MLNSIGDLLFCLAVGLFAYAMIGVFFMLFVEPE
jgi:hypothetical protein